MAEKEPKLELAASMVRQVMPEFKAKKNVIILCDSWYVKKDLAAIVDDYENLDLIGNARSDSVLYDLPPAPTGRKSHHSTVPGAVGCSISPCCFIPSDGTLK